MTRTRLLKSTLGALTIFALALPMQGCVATTVAGATFGVAAAAVGTTTKVAGAAVGVTAGAVGAVGRTVTGAKR